jgi:hypothetical protein
VRFSKEGFPDFSPYDTTNGKIRIKYTGTRNGDFAEADRLAGFTADNPRPEGFTWHHHHDVGANGEGLMQLVPTDLHDAVQHTGGVSIWQSMFPGQGNYQKDGYEPYYDPVDDYSWYPLR